MLALLGFGAAYEGGHPQLAESARDTVLFGYVVVHACVYSAHISVYDAASVAA